MSNMEQPPVSRFPPLYVQSTPCDIALGPYVISVRKLYGFDPMDAGFCTSLVLDLPFGRVNFPCNCSMPQDYSFKDLLLEKLTSWFSGLGLPQDCDVDRLVKEISRVVICAAMRKHDYLSWLTQQPRRVVDVPYVSVETALRVKRATEESIEALEMVDGAAELEDYNDDSCAICFENLDAEIVGGMARLPCAHVYHKECVVEWLRKSHVCPLCRFEMPVIEDSS